MNDITFEEFVTEFETLNDENRDKEAALLVGHYPDLYKRYWVEVWGEELT